MQIKLNVENFILPIENEDKFNDILSKTIDFISTVENQFNENVVKLKNNKIDRRMLISGWNPTDRKDVIYNIIQFYFIDDKLSTKVFQRKIISSNVLQDEIAPMILMMYIMCKLTNLKPYSYIHTFGDGKFKWDYDKSIYPQLQFSDDEIINIFDLKQKNFKISFNNNVTLNGDTIFGISYVDRFENEELQYIELVKDIIKYGKKFDDRTGVGTKSLFGPEMKFSLHNYTLPLLTTKRVFYRGIIEELLWFIRGSTDSCELTKKGVHIWDGNGSKEFLEKCGLGHREEGDLGPVYGFQWRHFGAQYKDKHADYTNQGYDQLNHIIECMKVGKENGDAIIMAWNPPDIPIMALPPCHCAVQFMLDSTTKQLSCKLYQRSADLGLGVPFNIASYSIMTLMLCHMLKLEPGYFYHTIGDAHVYLNHIDPIGEQLIREPRQFPVLKFKREIENIHEFIIEDFDIIGYNPHPKLPLAFAL